MKGSKLKAILLEKKVQQKDLADYLGVTKQSLSSYLSSDDVKSSLVEKVGAMLGVPISELYGETPISSASAASGGMAIAGSGNNLNTQVDKFLDLLKEKDVQMARSQAEIDKLLEILNRKLK